MRIKGERGEQKDRHGQVWGVAVAERKPEQQAMPKEGGKGKEGRRRKGWGCLIMG